MTSPHKIAGQIERLFRLYNSLAFRNDLRPSQWQTLRFFAEAPEEQRTITEFARYRATTMGTESTTVSGLVKRGLLERAGESQRRNSGVRLTIHGENALYDDPLIDLAQAIDQMSAETKQCFAEGLRELTEILETSGQDR
jgi:DNA-binding MarR family transcriptional regulator